MFAVSNLLLGLAKILDLFLTFYMILILGRVVISWVNADPYNPIVRFLYRATEPILYRLRRWFPWARNVGGLDLTPLFVIAFIYLLQYLVVYNLIDLAHELKSPDWRQP